MKHTKWLFYNGMGSRRNLFALPRYNVFLCAAVAKRCGFDPRSVYTHCVVALTVSTKRVAGWQSFYVLLKPGGPILWRRRGCKIWRRDLFYDMRTWLVKILGQSNKPKQIWVDCRISRRRHA